MQFLIISLIFVFTSFAQAQESVELYESAIKYYEQRESAMLVDQAIWQLNLAYKKNSNPLLAYKIKILSARFNLWKALNSKSKGMERKFYQQAILDSDKAKEIGLIDLDTELAEAFYYHAAASFGWAMSNGINELSARRKEILSDLDSALNLLTINKKEGSTLDHAGPVRLFGLVYDRLPEAFGGSRSRALSYILVAFEQHPEYLANGYSLAKVLLKGNRQERKKACQITQELLRYEANDNYQKIQHENKIYYMQLTALNTQSCALGGLWLSV